MSTGWFGVPGEEGTQTKTHFVGDDGKPICGSRIRQDSEFQFCSWRRVLHYVECERCRAIELKRLEKIWIAQRDETPSERAKRRAKGAYYT